MRVDEDGELTLEELDGLAALRREATPPAGLEERVVAALKGRGSIRTGGGWRKVGAVAASLLLIALAFVAGLRLGAAGGGEDQRPTFALLVYDPVGAAPRVDMPAAVGAAMAWGDEIRRQGFLERGEKLEDVGFRLVLRDDRVERVGGVLAPDATHVLGGLFLIHAADSEEAARIASTCPLLRYGSTIEVRAVARLPSAP